jgi:hypothetical protein
MRIKPIISLCKSRNIMELFYDSERDSQWLSDDIGIYLVDEFPKTTTEQICSIYDISQKTKDSMELLDKDELTDILNFDDIADEESPAFPYELRLNMNGESLILFKTVDGVFYINADYLKPLSNIPDEELFYMVRKINNGYCLAIKCGMFLKAIVLLNALSTQVINTLNEMYSLSTLAIKKMGEVRESNGFPPANGKVDID